MAYLTLKLKAVKNETAAIHAMVNGAMLANLRELAGAYRKVAARSGLPEDLAVADAADKKVEAHIQAMVEAATAAAKGK